MAGATRAAEAAGYDVLVVGGCGVDTIVQVDALPVPLADSVGVPPIREWVGHTGTGVALGCDALGLATGFADFIGEDRLGDMVRERLSRSSVDFRPLVSPHGTRRAVNLVDGEGRRMSFYDGRDPVDLRMPRDFYLPLLRRARHVHLSIMHFARFLLDDLEGSGTTVSTDLHDWDGRAAHHRDFALRSDLVFLSAAAIGGRVPEVLGGIMREGRARTVVATDGANGCWVLTRADVRAADGPGGPDDPGGQGAGPRHFPAVRPPAPVVDSNGAGDAFVSGFLHGYLAGRPVEECALLGSVSGAHACTGEGTHGALIDAAGLAAGAEAAGPGWTAGPE
ncbi:carbohydrate kinase family protein [Streptomyces thermolineatus]|uniref:carbohydrate kinase family protein n=1 Tax=Streptomyces thermolineatus TaxID=44033 RepID=UPI00384AD7B1